MRRSGKLKVVGNEACADGSAVLRLKTPVPHGIGPGDFVENADRFPDVLVERCRFGGGNRARGILLTTPGRTVVRDNLFRSSGAAILIEGDTSYWFESGAVRDVEISGNVFDCCGTSARDSLSNWGWGEAPITISPSYSPKGSRSPAYHRGIKISNNHFRCFDNALLYARSVDGLKFVGNSVERISDYAPILKQRTPIRLDGCRHVRIRKNLGL